MTETTPGAGAPAALAARKLYFAAWRWHFYAGLYVIPFLLLLAVTGTIMVWFSAIAPEYGERLTIAAGPAPLGVQAQADAALAAYPGGTVTTYVAPWGPENPALFRVTPAEGPSRMLAINPYDGTVLRDMEHGATWEEWADLLHGQLMQTGPAKPYGDFLIEVAASLALLLVATGLYMAWPRDRGLRAMLLPDLRLQGRALWKSLHTALGAWISLILVFFLISGLSWAGIWGGKFVQAWSTFPAEKWDNVPLSDLTHASMNHTAKEVVPWAMEQTPLPASGSAAGVAGIAEGQPVSLETVAALARSIGFDGRFQLAVPAGETGVWTISRDSMSWDSTDPTSDRTVHVDQYSGRILADVGFADYSAYGKAMSVGIPLHMGLMGTWNAVLNIGICLVLIVVALSSVAMWWQRRPSGAARLVAPPRPDEVPFARGAILITLALALAFPVLGLTLLAMLALDLLVLSPIPALKRALS
ncbi:MAG: PepSY domain-containing protein [Paracoccaceae bacterium]